MTVEPPAHDSLWDDDIQNAQGDYDREVWLEAAVTLHGLDRDLLEDKPTGWIVNRVNEEPNRYYRT